MNAVITPTTKLKTGWELRNDCRKLLSAKDQEVVLSGPADTGKTVACCIKAHLICLRYAGAQGAIVRKTRSSLAGTVCRTFDKIIAHQGVVKHGGESPNLYLYPNGSRVWLGGMDNPDKVLSSERDFIYTNQTEEMSLNDWEILVTRCSGRGAVIPHPQLFGDCNPSGSKHWIRARAAEGKLLLLVTVHRDNPTLYDTQGNLTPEGSRRLEVLQSLSGVRYKRLFKGIWATAEGAVYDMFDPQVHVCTWSEADVKTWYLAQDEGFTNPAVILLVGEDSDGRWHIFREWYERGKLQGEVVEQAKRWSLEKKIRIAAVDESAAGLIADERAAGIPAQGAKGRVIDGINAIQNRLRVLADGRPRLTVDPGCVNTINEFESYVWAPDKPKDTPVKEFDHAMDAIRYLEDYWSIPSGAFDSAAIAGSVTGDNNLSTSSEVIEIPYLSPSDM